MRCMRLRRLFTRPVPAVRGAAVAGLALLAACSPSLNWREYPMPPTRLQAMMPCKPEEATRAVPLAGHTVTMHLAGCDAGGASFLVGWATAEPPDQLGVLLGAWQDATLAQAGIPTGPDGPAGKSFVPSGAVALPQSVRLAAPGRRPDGQPLALQAAWFAGTGGATPRAFHAAVYGTPAGDAADTFFAGLRLLPD